jgi:hypothetical protein
MMDEGDDDGDSDDVDSFASDETMSDATLPNRHAHKSRCSCVQKKDAGDGRELWFLFLLWHGMAMRIRRIDIRMCEVRVAGNCILQYTVKKDEENEIVMM